MIRLGESAPFPSPLAGEGGDPCVSMGRVRGLLPLSSHLLNRTADGAPSPSRLTAGPSLSRKGRGIRMYVLLSPPMLDSASHDRACPCLHNLPLPGREMAFAR